MLRLKRKELPLYSISSLLLWYTCSSLYLLPLLLQNFFPLSFFARLFLRGGGGGEIVEEEWGGGKMMFSLLLLPQPAATRCPLNY